MSRSTQTQAGLLGLGSPVARQLLLCVVIIAAFALMMIAGWNHYADKFASREEFLLSPSDILINKQPDWIHSNVLIDTVNEEKLPEKLDLRDRELTSKIATAFSNHAWIRKVNKVIKQYPAKVLVDVEYRRPVAVVEVVFTDKFGNKKRGLVPIDGEGTILPDRDFSPAQAAQYPRILIDLKTPWVGPGQKWEDPRIADAALIAMELLPYWNDLKLTRIVLKEESGSHYELELADNTRIIWGSPPGKELPQEAMAKHKVQVILQKAAESNLSSNEAQPSLDLRTAGRGNNGTDMVRR
ncbi:cell division protein FtsQ/DivIB [Blastopirellula marina]|uniref:POTRA domain-containing protein n=1 Tax=Blastopirellula marina TaxID=124 RepID=A0A2S8G0D8_9BACT|nr:hypothetical protein [Blastopirellula marina]PQO37912.1 hypothetical protein C5Y98_07395 [Blastopirellula marina]PTL44568.1 hypothetical protein C5Y97_07395 [Blastopirellula marina]